MKNLIRCLMIFLFSISLNAQIERVEPPNWWIGFENIELQLLIKGNDIRYSKVYIDYDGVNIVNTHYADSPNYIFLDLEINSNTTPGNFNITLITKENKTHKYLYSLNGRSKSNKLNKGFDSSDVIYLITPDRFANGDSTNDKFNNLREKSIDRANDYGRHGGDIRGIINNLDYIQKMGFTSIWSTPLLINDMEEGSYHGYAITDYYKVDPRFGSLDEYIELSEEAKKRGLKLLMDQIANHCGVFHWWMDDFPFDNWINYQDDFINDVPTTYSNHRRTTHQDTYSAEIDAVQMVNGWFVDTMPDLNQTNDFMSNYIIQNSIWWIETIGLSGIRQDTYPYPDKEFMSKWANSIMVEYPNFNIVGEEWSLNPLLVSYWQKDSKISGDYKSNLPSAMDFPMQNAIFEGINEIENWNTGLIKIYEGLANDFIYPNPQSLLLFSDNHDMSRIYTQFDEDIVKTKMALSLILTMPRIPQIYYGTEVLLSDKFKPGDHGLIRTDFPGGWKNDTSNGFDNQGLSEIQLEMKNFLMKLLNFRKKSNAIHKGKTIHFAPIDGVYLIARTYKDEVLINIINKNESTVKLDLKRFDELNLNGFSFLNVLTNEILLWENEIKLNKKGSYILNLQKP